MCNLFKRALCPNESRPHGFSAIAAIISTLTFFIVPNILAADELIPNEPVTHYPSHAETSTCYAVSTPLHTFDPWDEVRQQGKTEVYQDVDGEIHLIQTYDWYSAAIDIFNCGDAAGITLVRHGPLHFGDRPKASHLAIAFYRNGQLLNEYSTLEVALHPAIYQSGKNIRRSSNFSLTSSHYTVFTDRPMLSVDTEPRSHMWELTAQTVDGRTLVFNALNGELVSLSYGS